MRASMRSRRQSIHPDVKNYVAQVNRAGGSISTKQIAILDQYFVKPIYKENLRSKIQYAAPLATQTLNGLFTPIFNNVLGISYTGNNLSAANYNVNGASRGYLGNSSNMYVNTGYNSSNLLMVDIHVAAFPKAAITPSDTSLIGNANGNELIQIVPQYTNPSDAFFACGPGANQVQFSNSAAPISPYIATRTASSLSAYTNGIQRGSTTSQGNSTNPNLNIFALARNNSGTPGNYTPNRICFYGWGRFLSTQEVLTYTNRINTLDANLAAA